MEKKNKNNSKILASKIIKEIIQLFVLAVVIVLSFNLAMYIYFEYFSDDRLHMSSDDCVLMSYKPVNEEPKYYCCKKSLDGDYSICVYMSDYR